MSQPHEDSARVITTQENSLLALEAVRIGDRNRLRDLIEAQPELVRERYQHGDTLLTFAAAAGRVVEVHSLLEAGADVAACDVSGDSALHWAAKQGYIQIVKALYNAGAAINSVNTDGWTPLHFAACNGQEDVVAFLLAVGAKHSIENNEGETALFMAAKNTHKGIVEMIMGKDVNGNEEVTTFYGDKTVIG
jgi:ankyrin repeat protein